MAEQHESDMCGKRDRPENEKGAAVVVTPDMVEAAMAVLRDQCDYDLQSGGDMYMSTVRDHIADAIRAAILAAPASLKDDRPIPVVDRADVAKVGDHLAGGPWCLYDPEREQRTAPR